MPAALIHPPGTDAAHPGVFKHSSGIVRVSDLRFQFGVNKRDWQQPGRQIITNLAGEHIGFWVDEIIDVVSFPQNGWNDLPLNLPRGIFSKTLLINDHIHLFAEFDKLNTLQGGAYLQDYISSLEENKIRKPKQADIDESTVANKRPSTHKVAVATQTKPTAAMDNIHKSAAAMLAESAVVSNASNGADQTHAEEQKLSIDKKHVERKAFYNDKPQTSQRQIPRRNTTSAAKITAEAQQTNARATVAGGTLNRDRNIPQHNHNRHEPAVKTSEILGHTTVQTCESSGGMGIVWILLVFVLAAGAGGYYLLMDNSSESVTDTYLETMPSYAVETYSLDDTDAAIVNRIEDMSLAATVSLADQEQRDDPLVQVETEQVIVAEVPQPSVAAVETQIETASVAVEDITGEKVMDEAGKDQTTEGLAMTEQSPEYTIALAEHDNDVPANPDNEDIALNSEAANAEQAQSQLLESATQDDNPGSDSIAGAESKDNVEEIVVVQQMSVDDVPVEQAPETSLLQQDVDIKAMTDLGEQTAEQQDMQVTQAARLAIVDAVEATAPMTDQAMSEQNNSQIEAMTSSQDNAANDIVAASELDPSATPQGAAQPAINADATQELAVVTGVPLQEQASGADAKGIEQSKNKLDDALSSDAHDKVIKQGEQTADIVETVVEVTTETDGPEQQQAVAADVSVTEQTDKDIEGAMPAQTVVDSVEQVEATIEIEAAQQPDVVIKATEQTVESVQLADVAESAKSIADAVENPALGYMVTPDMTMADEAANEAEGNIVTQQPVTSTTEGVDQTDQSATQLPVDAEPLADKSVQSEYKADIIKDEQGVTIVLRTPADKKVLIDEAVVTPVLDDVPQQTVPTKQTSSSESINEPVMENGISDQDAGVATMVGQTAEPVLEAVIVKEAQDKLSDQTPVSTSADESRPEQTDVSLQLAAAEDTARKAHEKVTTQPDAADSSVVEKADGSDALVTEGENPRPNETPTSKADDATSGHTDKVRAQQDADIVAMLDQSAQTTDDADVIASTVVEKTASVDIAVTEESDDSPVDTASVHQSDQTVEIVVSKVDQVKVQASSTPAKHKVVMHIVVKGDTLWHIAERYVNNPFLFPELARLSNIKNPDLIYPGDRVRIIHYPLMTDARQ